MSGFQLPGASIRRITCHHPCPSLENPTEFYSSVLAISAVRPQRKSFSANWLKTPDAGKILKSIPPAPSATIKVRRRTAEWLQHLKAGGMSSADGQDASGRRIWRISISSLRWMNPIYQMSATSTRQERFTGRSAHLFATAATMTIYACRTLTMADKSDSIM